MMNPAHLDLFRAVLRHGGITRAAEALGIGQPHVSRAIAQMEADLGFPLFVRGHGSVLATREGESFAREVERSHAGLERLHRAARQIREVGAGPVRVACQPSLVSRMLPRAIRRLSADHPGVRVAVHVPDPDTIWSWASSAQCDIGLVRPRSGYAGVTCEPFLTVDAVCALPGRHPLAGKQVITVRDLAGEPMIAGGTGVFQQSIEAAFAQAGVEPRFVLMAQYTAARCGLVAEGLGITVVDPVAARSLTCLPIVLRPLQPHIPIETVLIRPSGRPPCRITARLIDLLRSEGDALSRGQEGGSP